MYMSQVQGLIQIHIILSVYIKRGCACVCVSPLNSRLERATVFHIPCNLGSSNINSQIVEKSATVEAITNKVYISKNNSFYFPHNVANE